METQMALEKELKHLSMATQSIFQRFANQQMDLDDIIEEFRPIQMRMYAIACKLKEIKVEAGKLPLS